MALLLVLALVTSCGGQSAPETSVQVSTWVNTAEVDATCRALDDAARVSACFQLAELLGEDDCSVGAFRAAIREMDRGGLTAVDYQSYGCSSRLFATTTSTATTTAPITTTTVVTTTSSTPPAETPSDTGAGSGIAFPGDGAGLDAETVLEGYVEVSPTNNPPEFPSAISGYEALREQWNTPPLISGIVRVALSVNGPAGRVTEAEGTQNGCGQSVWVTRWRSVGEGAVVAAAAWSPMLAMGTFDGMTAEDWLSKHGSEPGTPPSSATAGLIAGHQCLEPLFLSGDGTVIDVAFEYVALVATP